MPYTSKNNVRYFFSIYDTACMTESDGIGYTERTCRLKIDLRDSINFPLDTFAVVKECLAEQSKDGEFQTEYCDGYIWIWRRRNIRFEFFEDYGTRYCSERRVHLFREMDKLCFSVHCSLRDYLTKLSELNSHLLLHKSRNSWSDVRANGFLS